MRYLPTEAKCAAATRGEAVDPPRGRQGMATVAAEPGQSLPLDSLIHGITRAETIFYQGNSSCR